MLDYNYTILFVITFCVMKCTEVCLIKYKTSGMILVILIVAFVVLSLIGCAEINMQK